MPNLADAIGRHLPYLRRYARAVTGDQAVGDAAVRACLQNLLANPQQLGPLTLKRDLYQALTIIWSKEAETAEPAVGGMVADTLVLTSRMAHLAAPQRQILLLTTLEGFTFDEARMVMGLGSEAAGDLLSEAKRELKAQPATRVLIIEDEPIIALDLAATVQLHGHEVVGIAATHKEAVDLALRERPGLVLADIKLKDDSSGLEAVQEILGSIAVPVIFVTAYPERLLTGERPEPTFLLTKPFDPDTLAVSISQALTTSDG